MGWGDPSASAFHSTEPPKPLGRLGKLYLMTVDAFMANIYNLLVISQIARAPYLHLEKDLKSLKHVLEMKNHQIHEQEKKIMELEKQVSCHFSSRGGIPEVEK